MGDTRIEVLDVKPAFDMIGFMEMSKENRLDGPVCDKMMGLWDKWLDLLQVRSVVCGKIGYLVVWLPEEVDNTVEQMWDAVASEGYLANCLAQYMCMQAVSEKLPMIADSGCAPAPKPTQALREALKELGLEYRDDVDVLERRFAVVTLMPFRGGCEVCHLQKDCPKGSGGVSEDGSLLLPGYEHPGVNE